MKASQMGATEAGVCNPIGYYIHYDPSEILVVWAGEKMVDKNSKTPIDPMIASILVIRDAIVKKRTLEGGNTTDLSLMIPIMTGLLEWTDGMRIYEKKQKSPGIIKDSASSD